MSPAPRIVWEHDGHGVMRAVPVARHRMVQPAVCDTCGATFDVAKGERTARYADCDVFKTPCCGRTADTRVRWGGGPNARNGYTLIERTTR